ncbi:CDGSH iron-sulfur domain-containing protein [Saccharicrinis sp. FJH2]|uniref:CDGSH iron-sulfur domain-containing protein n=1 Tax=Saccharicrinis sp. FJH65 TaxID=3344659 RepID=UPI0035F49429
MKKGQIAGKAPRAFEIEKGKTYVWCRCGRSANQPFCDGSHKVTEFTPVIFKAEETKKVFFCMCKQTSTPPFCDGTHNTLK